LAPFEQSQFARHGTWTLRPIAPAHLLRLLGAWRGGGSAYVELAAALRALIVDGRLPPRTRLPSERALAEILSVSRNTATGALDVLRSQGYLVSQRGAGSWVSYPTRAPRRPDEPLPLGPEVIDLTLASLPAPPRLAALALDAATELATELACHGYEPFGLTPARAAVARHLTGHGLTTAPDQVLITQGSLHGFDLALRALARPGDRVLVESPSYPAALDAIAAHHCEPVGVPVGQGGWDLELMLSALQTGPRLAYLIPDFHNPTGTSASHMARSRVVREARRAGVIIVSDESLAELRLDRSPRPRSLGVFDRGGTVLVLGSLSKAVWGGLRSGWVRGAPALVRGLALGRGSQDVGSPVLDQFLTIKVLEQLDAILPERLELLAARRDALIAAIEQERPRWRANTPPGGLSVWIELPPETSSSTLAVRALERGVRVAPGPRFSATGGFEQRLRLPFTHPPELLAEATRRLAAAEDTLDSRPAVPRPPVRWVA
jgi:DNA-binding transcriptional MocR family regulator